MFLCRACHEDIHHRDKSISSEKRRQPLLLDDTIKRLIGVKGHLGNKKDKKGAEEEIDKIVKNLRDLSTEERSE